MPDRPYVVAALAGLFVASLAIALDLSGTGFYLLIGCVGFVLLVRGILGEEE